jgi:DNA (cytosine-5)-methyltransferase 1
MRVLDLFSGIGGFSLGLERAGMRTVAFCEIDPYCRSVLARHWPDIPCHPDVRTLTGISADVICGGFPCQDVSVAGKRKLLAGERSGLWSEYARLIGEVGPRFVLVENVPGLLSGGMGQVLGDLSDLGYDAEWDVISAAEIGADHLRERVWIVAYPHGLRKLQPQGIFPEIWRRLGDRAQAPATDFDRSRLQERFMHPGVQGEAGRDGDGQDAAVDAGGAVEPHLVRRLHGIPNRVDRIKALGNSVVPQIPEIIGRAIMNSQHTV